MDTWDSPQQLVEVLWVWPPCVPTGSPSQVQIGARQAAESALPASRQSFQHKAHELGAKESHEWSVRVLEREPGVVTLLVPLTEESELGPQPPAEAVAEQQHLTLGAPLPVLPDMACQEMQELMWRMTCDAMPRGSVTPGFSAEVFGASFQSLSLHHQAAIQHAWTSQFRLLAADMQFCMECMPEPGCQAALLQYEHVMIPLVLFLRDNHCSVTLATLLLKLNQAGIPIFGPEPPPSPAYPEPDACDDEAIDHDSYHHTLLLLGCTDDTPTATMATGTLSLPWDSDYPCHLSPMYSDYTSACSSPCSPPMLHGGNGASKLHGYVLATLTAECAHDVGMTVPLAPTQDVGITVPLAGEVTVLVSSPTLAPAMEAPPPRHEDAPRMPLPCGRKTGVAAVLLLFAALAVMAASVTDMTTRGSMCEWTSAIDMLHGLSGLGLWACGAALTAMAHLVSTVQLARD